MHTPTKGTTHQTLLFHNFHVFSRRFAQESHANLVEINVGYITVVLRDYIEIDLLHLSRSTVKMTYLSL